MAHTQTKELNKIPLGSMDFYVVEWTGTMPTDAAIEIEGNLIGRTKKGATINYATNWYVAESDDGKAKKRKITSESASISYGNITWNSNTLAKLIATARVTEDATTNKRTTKIGGVANDNGKRYLIRGVYTDKVDGDRQYFKGFAIAKTDTELFRSIAKICSNNDEKIKVTEEFVIDNFTVDDFHKFVKDFGKWINEVRESDPN